MSRSLESHNPVRFTETRNRTQKSLQHAEAFSNVLETIGTTIGSPDAFAPIREFLGSIADNPKLTVVDCWFAAEQEKLEEKKRPVLLVPFHNEASNQPVKTLCIRLNDYFLQFALDELRDNHRRIVDAPTSMIATTMRDADTAVMEVFLGIVQKEEGPSVEQTHMRIVEDPVSAKLTLMYNTGRSATSEERKDAFVLVERGEQQIPLQLSAEDGKKLRDAGQYFRRFVDRESSKNIYTVNRQPRLKEGTHLLDNKKISLR